GDLRDIGDLDRHAGRLLRDRGAQRRHVVRALAQAAAHGEDLGAAGVAHPGPPGVIMMAALHALSQAADENKVGARSSPRCQSAAERTSSGGRTFRNLSKSRMSYAPFTTPPIKSGQPKLDSVNR